MKINAMAWLSGNWIKPLVGWRQGGRWLAAGMLLAGGVLLAAAGGCDDSASQARALRPGHTQLGYGRVAFWAVDPDLLKAELRACDEAGIRIYTASLLGWWRFAMPGATEAQIRMQTQTAYKVLVNECRARGMIALIDVHNQNSGSRKYGERGRKLDDPAEVALIDWGIDLIRKHGPDNVVVIPCREAREASGFAIEQKCVERLKGFQLCANAGSRTWPVPGWADYAEWHPWSVNESPPVGAIVCSDTGAILSQLNAGGVFGPGKPAVVQRWMQAGVVQGNPARVLYTLYPGPVDTATLHAIGTAVP